MDTCDYIWFTEDPITCTSSSSSSGERDRPLRAQIAEQSSSSSTCDPGRSRRECGEDSGDGGPTRGVETSSTPVLNDAGRRRKSRVEDDGTHVGYELRPVAVLLPPEGHRLQKGLPSKFLGSDHVCLVVDFEVSPSRNVQ
jgi:hypothetical protein